MLTWTCAYDSGTAGENFIAPDQAWAALHATLPPHVVSLWTHMILFAPVTKRHLHGGLLEEVDEAYNYQYIPRST